MPSQQANVADATGTSPAHASTDNTFAYLAGGLGVMAVGAGTYFGVRALRERRIADKHCEDTCSSEGRSHDKNAVFNGWLSTASFGVGVAALWISIHYYSSASQRAEYGQRTVRFSPQVSGDGASVDLAWNY